MRPVETPTNPFDRLPPHSIESEMCLIASMILDSNCVSSVRAIVDRADFFQADHQIIFDAICAMVDANKSVDALTVRTDLDRRGLLESIGGTSYLAEMISGVPSAGHAVQYATDVRERAACRTIITLANDLTRRAYGPHAHEDWKDTARVAMDALVKLHQRSAIRQAIKLDAIIDDVYKTLVDGGGEKIPTGFAFVDEMLGGGIELGEFFLIGARPSMGKSVLAKQMALRSAKAGVPSLLLSLEEKNRKIGRNIISSEARIDNHKLRNPGGMDSRDWNQIHAAVGRLGSIPLYSIDSICRMDELRAEVSRCVAQHGVKLVVLDYLQRVDAGGKTDYERATASSKGVCAMLKELNVAGVVPVQLSRGLEQREDKRPGMTDLRASGQIEQDADVIAFLHREDYYHTNDKNYQPTKIAELIFAKFRDGIRGKTVKLGSSLAYQTFDDIEQVEDPFGE